MRSADWQPHGRPIGLAMMDLWIVTPMPVEPAHGQSGRLHVEIGLLRKWREPLSGRVSGSDLLGGGGCRGLLDDGGHDVRLRMAFSLLIGRSLRQPSRPTWTRTRLHSWALPRSPVGCRPWGVRSPPRLGPETLGRGDLGVRPVIGDRGSVASARHDVHSGFFTEQGP